MECIAKTVEGERARQRNGVTAIDQAAAEPAFAFGKLIEMNTCGVLVKPRGGGMLGFFDGNAVHVIDLFAGFIMIKTVWAAGENRVVGRSINRRAAGA